MASLAVAGTACTAQPASSARCLQHILSLTTLSVKNLFTGCLDLFDTFEFPLTADWIFWSTLPAQLILTGHLTGEWGGEGSGEDRGEEQEKEMFTTLSRSQEPVSLLLAQSALSVWR